MSRRVDIEAILCDPVLHRKLTQAREGIVTSQEQAEAAYDKVQEENVPRRQRYDAEGRYEDGEGFASTRREPEDVRVAPGIPTLYEIRKHITYHAWNGGECLPYMTNEQVFDGQCEYASTAMSEILTGTGKYSKPVDWSLRRRGWYKGPMGALKLCSESSSAWLSGKHCHSWVEFGGKIIDPTWWQFNGEEVRVYVFELGDPRFVPDPSA